MTVEILKKPALLCGCRLAVAVGVVWGLGLVILGAIAMASESWCHQAVDVLGNVYLGFEASIGGLAIGFLWGLADGFIGTAIIVGLYNLFCRAGCCCCAPAEDEKRGEVEAPKEPEATAEPSQL